MLVTRCRELVKSADWLDSDCRYILSGKLERQSDCLEISGYWGTVSVEGIPEELDAAESLLRSFDGHHDLGHPRADLTDIVQAVVSAGAAFDARHAWLWFNDISANPAPFYGLRNPLDAYAIPIWQHPSATRHRPIVPPPAGVHRTSTLHDPGCVDQFASTHAALTAARAAYAADDDGSRPVPSAGAIYPLHLWVIAGSGADEETTTVFYVPETDDRLVETGCSVAQARLAFEGDPEVDAVLSAGAAVIAVTVDPGQMVAKYGNRGWRYCLIEAGAVMTRAQDRALDDGARLRPFGGFRDELLAELLDISLLPLLVLLVTARTSA